MPNQVHICKCKSCRDEFIFREAERLPYDDNKNYLPWYCPSCVIEHRAKKSEEAKAADTLEKQKRKEKALAVFESALAAYHVVSLKDIHTNPDNTLIVIGNGFDLMHGVKSD